MRKCSNCGFENTDDSNFCTNCGSALESNETVIKRCSFCGAENTPESKFCIKCGASIVDTETSVIFNSNVSNKNDNFNNVQKSSTLNNVGMILGIISVASILVCCCGLFGFLSIIPGILAVVFSIIYMVKYNANDGKAIAGLILGIIGVILSIIIMIILPGILEGFEETAKEFIVESCANGSLDDETCGSYRELYPEWFQWLFIK